ncbi:MAG: hypothetical protein KGI70_00225 [Patescibacteria group bacterium]|nr:hypothetical protein [Patescibacteria group bacterium]
MIFNWALYIVLAALSYIGISLMGQLGGAPASGTLGVLINAYKPLTLLVMLVANGLWIVAVYYGLQETRTAIPAAIALGVVVSFVYSLVFLGGTVTPLRVGGLVLILAGIYLLA